MCLCDAAGYGKADTRARTWLLGGKERIEDAAADFRQERQDLCR